jgi:hypothetical protein
LRGQHHRAPANHASTRLAEVPSSESPGNDPATWFRPSASRQVLDHENTIRRKHVVGKAAFPALRPPSVDRDWHCRRAGMRSLLGYSSAAARIGRKMQKKMTQPVIFSFDI